MQTGMVDNWDKVDSLGAIYPFVGTEFVLFLLGITFWIVWHIWQIRSENKEFENDLKKIREQGGVANVLDHESEREIGDITGH